MTSCLRRPLRLLSATLTVLVVLTAPASAEICGPFPCEPAFVAPVAGASIPANVPAFPLIPEEVYGQSVVDAGLEFGPLDARGNPPPTPTIELLDPLGQVVPVDILLAAVPGSGSYNIIPRTTLVPGAYRFRQPISCQGSATSVPVVLTVPSIDDQPFTVIAAAPLPSAVGSVTVSPSQMTTYRIGAYADGVCSEEKTAAVATLVFTSSPELAPFLPVARFEVYVNGVDWWFTNWGNVDIEPHPASQPFYDRFFTVCPPEEFAPGLPEGAYTGSFTVRLPGQEPLPAVPFSFTLSCVNTVAEPSIVGSDAGSGTAVDQVSPEPGLDGGSANRDASVAADVRAAGDSPTVVPPGPDAAVMATHADAAADTPQAPSSKSGGAGCQCSLTRKNGGMTGVLWLLGLGIVGRTRSSRRRSGRA